MKIFWILVVLVVADGEWREWDHRYTRLAECLEVREIITHRREDQIQARCEAREMIKQNED